LKKKIDSLNSEHDEVHEQKKNIKYDNEDLNQKILMLEEDLYESKTIQLDLLEQLKTLEQQLHQAETKI
jgi:formylmethanofuran dehydrogenase subunit E